MVSVALAQPSLEARGRDAFIGLGGAAWMGYTYVYPSLVQAHVNLGFCPFYVLTGHPCPFCGGTRSFSAMWRGDLGRAAHFYPLGPLLFVLTFPLVAYGLAAILSGQTLKVTLRPSLQRVLLVAGLTALSVSWTLKLIWLGN